MYLLFPGASLTIARNLIRVTGTPEIWATLRQESTSKAPPRNLWREVLGLNVCNLAQTMAEGSVDRELDPEDRQDILEDFVMEILRAEKWVPTQDGAERMDLCMEVLTVAERLKPHFNRTRIAQGLRPRPEAVKDLLFSLGMEKELGLQKTLTALIDTQHQRFVDYFRGLFEPFPREEKGTEKGIGTLELPAPPEVPQKVDPSEPRVVLEGPSSVPKVQGILETSLDLGPGTIPEVNLDPTVVLEAPLDLDSMTVDPLTGMPHMAETPAEGPVPIELPVEGSSESEGVDPVQETVVVEAPVEAWVEEGASLSGGETQVATEAEPQPPFQEPAIQPLNRSRSSIGRSVDPQKLAKVLEYLLSPTDSDPPDLSSGPFPVLPEEDAEAAKEIPMKGALDPGVTESAPLTTEDPSFPQSGEEGSSLSSETNV